MAFDIINQCTGDLHEKVQDYLKHIFSLSGLQLLDRVSFQVTSIHMLYLVWQSWCQADS